MLKRNIFDLFSITFDLLLPFRFYTSTRVPIPCRQIRRPTARLFSVFAFCMAPFFTALVAIIAPSLHNPTSKLYRRFCRRHHWLVPLDPSTVLSTSTFSPVPSVVSHVCLFRRINCPKQGMVHELTVCRDFWRPSLSVHDCRGVHI